MIKKILVALDSDSDTRTATRYAVEIAQRSAGSVTGLAVVDMGSIAASSRGGGIGAMYFAEKLKKRLTAETRETAQKLVAEFERAVSKTGVPHTELVQEGVPFRRILEDMKYHDLLIVGDDPHFFYSHPKQATETLARVVRGTVGPTLIVGKDYRPIRKVLVAFDGSSSAARALRTFAWFRPFGVDVNVRIISIYNSNDAEAELHLSMARVFAEAHGLNVETKALKGSDVYGLINEQIDQYGADLVVAGARSRSRLRKVAFGSTTASLVESCPVSLYLDS